MHINKSNCEHTNDCQLLCEETCLIPDSIKFELNQNKFDGWNLSIEFNRYSEEGIKNEKI